MVVVSENVVTDIIELFEVVIGVDLGAFCLVLDDVSDIFILIICFREIISIFITTNQRKPRSLFCHQSCPIGFLEESMLLDFIDSFCSKPLEAHVSLFLGSIVMSYSIKRCASWGI